MMKSSQSALVTAAINRDLAGVRAALDAVGDPNQKDRGGRTALHHAAASGFSDVVSLLLSCGAWVDVRDSRGWSPLHFAAAEYHPETASVLLDAGALVDAEDEHGNTPLFRATFESRGRGEIITLLLSRGADPGHLNRHGTTPEGLARTIANYDVRQWFERSR